jgi:hypothetical protein
LELTKNYYKSLYTKQNNNSRQKKNEYLESITMPKLSEEDKLTCEGVLTLDEITKSLKAFHKNKTLGNYFITVEFYQTFWAILKKTLLVLECINSGYIGGKLSTSQRQAVITLLDKGKDGRLLKNWHPISLLNVDYKIGTKAIAERMKNILPKIIHHNQVGYVKGRQITDIRTFKISIFTQSVKIFPG